MANPNTLAFLRMQDIQIPDTNLKNQFDNAIDQGNYTLAIRILAQNDSLLGKSYTADVFNKIIVGISYLQKLYRDNTVVYMSGLSEEFEELVKRFHDLTEWDSSIVYNSLTFVNYNEEVYMAIQDSIPAGTLPTNEAFWLYLGLEGKVGNPGINGRFLYTWDGSSEYQANDVVVYNNKVYIAVKANTNTLPTDTTTWAILWQLIDGKIYVGNTEPNIELQNDIVWLQIPYDVENIPPNTPNVIGVFRRYDVHTAEWQDMFPNVLFEEILMSKRFRIKSGSYIVTMNKNVSSQDFSDPYITTNSIVRVMPNSSMSSTQYNSYNKLTEITIINGSFTLKSSEAFAASCQIDVQIIY